MITRILQSSPHNPRAWLEIGAGGIGSILLPHREEAKAEEASFGRPLPDQIDLVLMQEPARLARADLAIWETQRCAVPLLGFSLTAADEHGRGPRAIAWLTEDGEQVFAAGLCSVNELGHHPRSAFSLLVGSSSRAPLYRPLYIQGVPIADWLRMPGAQAMSYLRSEWGGRSLQAAAKNEPVPAMLAGATS
ncbi:MULTISPECIES: hypothetical protein [Gammaproteobacteria]|uniref:hypothetical protein n=1 Tax=Gammaproteobacteria TaxID=1236 RepID=UPI00112E79AB|nr:hypothetical protein [Pseudomonas sp. Hp2]